MLIPCIYYYFRFLCRICVLQLKEPTSIPCRKPKTVSILSCLLWKSNILGLWNNMLDDTLDADDETNERSYLASSNLFSLRI